MRIFIDFDRRNNIYIVHTMFQTWLRASKTELNEKHALCVELREFMRIVNHIGGEYSQWYIDITAEFKELVSYP